MQNQKKPIQQKKPMQNFTAEKWADKIALFIDNFGFLSGFFWHWTIALPSPTSHLAMLHSKIILSDPNRRVKVVLIGFSLFWSRCRTWGNFSILKPNFWSGDTAMGMAHWHNPKRVNFFSNILQNHYFVRWNSYFYQHFSGWLFFANFQTRISYFFTMGLSPCTAWVGDRYIGEVISPFRTLPWQKMTAQFQFFQSSPHKKADFVKKSRQNMGY